MSLTAAGWPQFAKEVFRAGIGRLTCMGSYVSKQVTTLTFRAQATTCSKHHTRTVMDTGSECAPWVRSANPSDSWALVFLYYHVHVCLSVCVGGSGTSPHVRVSPEHGRCVQTSVEVCRRSSRLLPTFTSTSTPTCHHSHCSRPVSESTAVLRYVINDNDNYVDTCNKRRQN